jgi:hypothetical protein
MTTETEAAPPWSESQARWHHVHTMFERMRHMSRSDWQMELKSIGAADPSVACDVLTLLVADESIRMAKIE